MTDREINLSVGLRIRQVREGLQMTRERFSEVCDISSSFLTAVENGQKGVTSKTLYKICTKANVSADYLLFGDEDTYSRDVINKILSQFDEQQLRSVMKILNEILYMSKQVNSYEESLPSTPTMHKK